MNDTIREALAGNRGVDQQLIAQAGVAWITLLLNKNRDYGSSVFTPPPLAPMLDPGTAILVRMGDKIKRIGQLMTQSPEVVGETLADLVTDLGAYCLLWTVMQNKRGVEIDAEVADMVKRGVL